MSPHTHSHTPSVYLLCVRQHAPDGPMSSRPLYGHSLVGIPGHTRASIHIPQWAHSPSPCTPLPPPPSYQTIPPLLVGLYSMWKTDSFPSLVRPSSNYQALPRSRSRSCLIVSPSERQFSWNRGFSQLGNRYNYRVMLTRRRGRKVWVDVSL